jgi:hypothetical protein
VKTEYTEGKWFKNQRLSKHYGNYYEDCFIAFENTVPWRSYLCGVSPNAYCDFLRTYSIWRVLPS